MALIPYEPFALSMPSRRWFPRLFGKGVFDEFFGNEFFKVAEPKVDVSETKKEYKITAELPGFEKDDIKVEVTDGTITLKAERKKEHEEKKEGYERYERYYGTYARSFLIPEEVEAEKIKAKLKDGVLKLTLPKTKAVAKEPETHQVAIQ